MCEAEEHSRPLPITHWISFDSPHRGAVIDHDLQDFLYENDPTNAGLGATAAKQLLNYSPFDGDGSVHNTFVNKRNSLNGGNYPQQCISIGVSFSNGLPNPHNNEEWLKIEIRDILLNIELKSKSKSFNVQSHWAESGSLLPALTANEELNFISLSEAIDAYIEENFDINLFYANTIRSTIHHPTFVTLKSALDMDEHGNSPFCYTLYSVDQDNFSHHDRVPEDLVERVVDLLQTSTLSDIAIGTYHNFGGEEAPSTHNSFDVFGKMYVNGDIGTGASASPQSPPANNSLFRLSTSCNTDYITLKNGAELLIGADSRGLKGEFVVRKGTILTLESGSLLVVHNNSKLVIEHGSSLKFFPNSQIILNGSNAILEIRGNLEIMNGATFTVSGGSNGMGKIIFNKDWTPDQPDYVGGNGNFVLNGTSKNTPHIEIYGNNASLISSVKAKWDGGSC